MNIHEDTYFLYMSPSLNGLEPVYMLSHTCTPGHTRTRDMLQLCLHASIDIVEYMPEIPTTVPVLSLRLVSPCAVTDDVTIFTVLHGMQTRSSDGNSVCLSVKRVYCDKTKEKSVQIFIPYERSFSLVFWEKEWLVGATPSTWNFGSTGPRWSEIADFEQIIASAVTRNKKIQLTLIGSPLRAFQWG